MEEVTYKGAKLSVEDFLQKIFGYVPTPKIKTSIEELKSYADAKVFDEDPLKAFQAVKTAQELQDFILNPKMQNSQVKDFLIHVLNTKTIHFRANAFKPCNKEHIALIFSSIFDFGEKPIGAPSPPPGSEDDKPPKIDLYAMKRILEHCKSTGKFTVRKDIDVTQFVLTERMPVTLMDNFNMIIPKDLAIYNGAAAIITKVTKDTPTKIAAAGHLKFYEGYTHIILESKNIEYSVFSDKTAFNIVIFPQSAKEQLKNEKDYGGEVYLAEAQIDLKPLEKADTTLCIDFGTSNTTVGTHGKKNSADNKQEIVPEIVKFLDETGDEPQERKILPTVVYVESVTENHVNYLFGYKALKRVIEKDYNTQASVFYEIKRWINSIDEEEFLIDEEGNKSKTKISHREIIKAYLEHVLDLAEQHFKRKFTKLHFTAPVKLKDSFIAELTKMFGKDGRTVLSAGESIDEGIAIIYNHIAEQMKKKIRDDKSQKVLIIDCGGGTTDLASCEYTLNTEGYSKKIDIVTRFENGDSNFGGNNITFRIFQLLKIKLAQKLKAEMYKSNIDANNSNTDEKVSADEEVSTDEKVSADEKVSVQDLIEDENNLLYKIDKNHAENTPPEDDRKLCYEKFNAEYEKAEKFVPTKFAAETFRNKKSQLKRNFYYLWQMAEAYKVQFYRAGMDFVSVNFSNAEDRKIGIPDDDKYYLYIRSNEDGELEKVMNPMSGIEVTNNEIHRLLYADIYSLLKNVLFAYDTNNDEQELLKYNHYKLSGQSCKITLFNELLKEFIPGKYLRYGEDKKESFDSIELKLACINGSIYYIRDTAYGEIKPHITMQTPKLIYDVCKLDVSGNIAVNMLQSRAEKIEPTVDVISSAASHVRYAIIAQNGKRQNTVDFEIETGHDTKTNTDEICRGIAWHSNDEDGAIGRYVRNELHSIKIPETVFALFTIPSKNGYGFYVYCVKVQNQQERYFMTQNPKYFPFENTQLETFFNGDR